MVLPAHSVAPPRPRGLSITAQIHRDLRADIISLRRKPGEPVIEKHIAEHYGVSRTPVREALLRLADERLIDVYPQSGTFVARIPVAELPEAIVIRTALEVSAVRFAAERASAAHIARLRACIEEQTLASADGDLNRFHETDEAMHALIATAGGYPRFWAVTEQVKVQVDRYRRLTLPEPGRIGHVVAEHRAIVEAVARHDPDAAEAGMRAHLDRLRTDLARAQGQNPYFFTGAAAAGMDTETEAREA